MQQWYSGLIPYALLLPIQVVILLLQWKISADVSRGAGLSHAVDRKAVTY